MGTIINIVIIGIIIICIWSGYKKGIIMGIGGILALIVALYGANLLANTFSYEVVPALKPFANGYMEGRINDKEKGIIKQMGWEKSEYSLHDLLEQNPTRSDEFAEKCYSSLGIDADASASMANEAVERYKTTGDMVDSVVSVLCEKVCFVGCFIIAFLLLIIILTVIGNLPNLSYKIPNLDIVNDIGGVLLGIATGFMFCVLLVWALKFFGFIIGTETLSKHAIPRFFLEHNFLTDQLGF